ncbi:hypothetical protein Ancab_023862 [Ancistrocladus abbreviatus]
MKESAKDAARRATHSKKVVDKKEAKSSKQLALEDSILGRDSSMSSAPALVHPSRNSIGDSNIANMNRIFLEKQAKDEAKMFWEMGKRLRATYDEDKAEVVDQLIAMENRD